MDYLPSYPIIAGALVTGYLAYRVLSLGSRDKAYPPGPKTLPLLGNVHLIPQVPTEKHVYYDKVAKEFGDVFSLKVSHYMSDFAHMCTIWLTVTRSPLQLFNKTMVVINSAKATNDLMDKRSQSFNGMSLFLEVTITSLSDMLLSRNNCRPTRHFHSRWPHCSRQAHCTYKRQEECNVTSTVEPRPCTLHHSSASTAAKRRSQCYRIQSACQPFRLLRRDTEVPVQCRDRPLVRQTCPYFPRNRQIRLLLQGVLSSR